MMIKKLIYTAFSAIALVSLTACSRLDVIGDYSIKAFDAVLNEAGVDVSEDSAFGGWSLEAPDKTARFVWSSDFSKTTEYDAFLEVDAQPFIDAGLNTDKLPEGMFTGDKLILGTDFGNDALTYNREVTPLASYKKIVELYRNNITYHAALDHYGISLTNGNMIEWAKDMSTNDKDLVFAINPDVFINAGVDPNKVDGWVFAKVPTMDEKGNAIEVDKLLKPFDLDGKPEK
jgi:hypothetical protein